MNEIVGYDQQHIPGPLTSSSAASLSSCPVLPLPSGSTCLLFLAFSAELDCGYWQFRPGSWTLHLVDHNTEQWCILCKYIDFSYYGFDAIAMPQSLNFSVVLRVSSHPWNIHLVGITCCSWNKLATTLGLVQLWSWRSDSPFCDKSAQPNWD